MDTPLEDGALVIGDISAFDAWRLRRADGSDSQPDAPYVPKPCFSRSDLLEIEDGLRSPWSQRILRALMSSGVPRPLHICVSSKEKVVRSPLVVSHVWRSGVPATQVTRLARGVYLCKPMFSLLQMAASASEVELALLAYELCGIHVLKPVGECGDEKLVCGLEQRYDVEGFREFAEQYRLAGVRGAARLLRALDMVVDASNSPAESRVAAMMVTPRRRGGFGLPGLKLNAKVPMTAEARKIVKSSTLRPDGLFEGHDEGYEFDSKTWHTSEEAIERDSIRRSALKASGIAVSSITSGQAWDLEKLRLVASGFAKTMGLPAEARGERMAEAQKRLHEELFPAGDSDKVIFGGHVW